MARSAYPGGRRVLEHGVSVVGALSIALAAVSVARFFPPYYAYQSSAIVKKDPRAFIQPWVGDLALLVAVLVWLSLLLALTMAGRGLPLRSMALTPTYAALLYLPIGALSLLLWLTRPLVGPGRYGPQALAMLLDEQVLGLTGLLAVPALAALSWSWAVALLNLLGRPSHDVRPSRDGSSTSDLSEVGRKRPRGALPLISPIFLLGAFLAIYTYLPGQNPTGRLVGLDIPRYYKPKLDSLAGQSPSLALGTVMQEPRASILLVLYGLDLLLGSSNLAIELAPLLLTLLLSLSTFAFASTLLGERRVALLSALLAIASPQVIGGMHSGILANWLALSIAYFFFATILKMTHALSLKALLGAMALSILLFFTHPWSWGVIMIPASVYLLASTIGGVAKGGARRAAAKKVLIPILVMAGILVLLAWALGSAGLTSRFSLGLQVAQSSFDLGNAWSYWTNLIVSVRYYAGSFFSNFPLYLLALFGILGLVRRRVEGHGLLLFWLGTVSFLSLFITQELQWRTLYLLPLHVPAALGLVDVGEWVSKKAGLGRFGQAILSATFLILLFNNAFRQVANLLPPPSLIP